MNEKRTLTNTSAAGLVATTFGVLAGLGGLTHGVGEILQGNVAPEGLIINSWTQGPIATNMGGEPGMTIVPNLLLTGLLTVAISLAVVLWSALFVQRRRGGLGLIALSVAMLLSGGGFGPPLIGILAGVAGTRVGAPLTWWRTRLAPAGRRFLAALWPWVYALAALNALFLVVGSVLLVYLFDLNNPDLFVNSFFFAILSIALAIVTGLAHDAQEREPAVAV